jgi:S-DNA-T family DNA segregation ATPase FtsK/SpoIIIE
MEFRINEMESRYTLFKDNVVRNIQDYNEKRGFAALPYIVIVIDEMADMMMSGGAEIEASIVRLAQKARATGIHLVLATQRPSVDVITGLIKANIPGRIGMSVATQIDSRVILDQIGAESLLGMGDLLFKEPDKSKPFRLQGVLVTQDEVQKVVKFLKEQVDEVEYNSEVTQGQVDPNMPAGARQSAKFSEDELFADAARVVCAAGKGSSSLIQRKLSVGYNRAARLLDELQKYGVVGPAKGSKPRDVLVSDVESFLGGGEE